MTQTMYVGNEEDRWTFFGGLSPDLSEVQTGTVFEMTLVAVDDPGGPIDPSPVEETEEEAKTSEEK